MPRKTVTIRDVAQRAGVGVSTVSYVLNGHDNHVGPDTRTQILLAARELGYRPNAIARSMVRKSTATIGLIFNELQNPLFVPVTVGVEEALRQEGYQTILANADTIEAEIRAIETLRGQQVDGIILMSLSRRYPKAHLNTLYAEEFPFIVINRDLDDAEIYQITLDDRGAGRLATEHLIRVGHYRIGIITGPMADSPNHRKSAVDRYEGWHETMLAHQLPIEAAWCVPGEYTFEGGYQAIRALFASHDAQATLPDALFVSSDMMAVGALKAFYDLGMRVPDDVAIATIGDPPYARYTVPALTTWSIPIAEAGQLAAQLIARWLKTGQMDGERLTTLPFTPHIRESCGANRVANTIEG